MCPSKLRRSKEPTSLISGNARALTCVDRDNRDTDECVRTAMVVSTPDDQLSRLVKERKSPLSGSWDIGEGTIWQIGVLNVFAGVWVGSAMMLPSEENSTVERSGGWD
jgi:hypothetical protein